MSWQSHWAELSPELLSDCRFRWVRSSVLTTALLFMFHGPVLETPLIPCPTKFINFLNNSQSFCCVFFILSSLAHWQHAQPSNSSCNLGLRWVAHILTCLQPAEWHILAVFYNKLKANHYHRAGNIGTAILSAFYFLRQWGLQLSLPIWGALLYCDGTCLFVYTKPVLLPFCFPCLVTFLPHILLNISINAEY